MFPNHRRSGTIRVDGKTLLCKSCFKIFPFLSRTAFCLYMAKRRTVAALRSCGFMLFVRFVTLMECLGFSFCALPEAFEPPPARPPPPRCFFAMTACRRASACRLACHASSRRRVVAFRSRFVRLRLRARDAPRRRDVRRRKTSLERVHRSRRRRRGFGDTSRRAERDRGERAPAKREMSDTGAGLTCHTAPVRRNEAAMTRERRNACPRAMVARRRRVERRETRGGRRRRAR